MWKKNFKRAGVGILTAGFIALLLWNPSSGRTPSDGKIHVQYWYVAGTRDDVPYHAQRFNQIQDSIQIDATPIPWKEQEKKILTAILSGNPPDVISQFVPVVTWASRLALTPLDSFIRADNFDTSRFFPALWDDVTWRGHVFAIPLKSASYAFFYNKELFREAGLEPSNPPDTWREVERYAQRLTQRNEQGEIVQMGFLPNYGNVHASMLMAWQLGASFISKDGSTAQLNTPAMRRALQWVVDYYDTYDLRNVRAFRAGLGLGDRHGFLTGKVAMAIMDMSFLDRLERFNPDLTFGVAMIPSFEDSPTASQAGSWWLSIPRGADNVGAAWEFIKFAVRKEVQLAEVHAMEADLFPANRHAAYDSTFMANDFTEVFVRQMEYAHSPAVVPMAHSVFWREFYGAQERVLRLGASPAEALAQAENVVQVTLSRANAYDQYVRTEMNVGSAELSPTADC